MEEFAETQRILRPQVGYGFDVSQVLDHPIIRALLVLLSQDFPSPLVVVRFARIFLPKREKCVRQCLTSAGLIIYYPLVG